MRAIFTLFLALAALALAACGDKSDDTAATHRCVAQYGADDGYDFVGDGWHVDCAAAPGDDDAACDPWTVADVEAACADDGHDCAGRIVVTRAAAACVAQEEGMAKGIDDTVHADLLYSDEHRLPIWAVSNVLVEEGAAASGESLHVSAVDAGALGHYEWSSTP